MKKPVYDHTELMKMLAGMDTYDADTGKSVIDRDSIEYALNHCHLEGAEWA